MKVIAISGTPGVGKTTLAKFLVRKLEFKRLDLHDHYQKISKGYNRRKQCYDLDLRKLTGLVKRLSKENNLVIDSHVGHLLNPKLVDLCLVLTCPNLKTLEKRLIKRGYSKKKVRENLDAEIFQVCLNETKEKKHRLLVIEQAKNQNRLLSKIKQML